MEQGAVDFSTTPCYTLVCAIYGYNGFDDKTVFTFVFIDED